MVVWGWWKLQKLSYLGQKALEVFNSLLASNICSKNRGLASRMGLKSELDCCPRKGITSSLSSFLSFTKPIVGNGQNIRFWMDCWSDSPPLEKVLSQGLCHNHPFGTSTYVETLGTMNGGIILLVRGSKRYLNSAFHS